MDLAVTLRARDEATPDIEKFGRGLREGTQTVRAMTGALLSEINPALGAFTSTMSLAARQAAQMPVILGAITVGVAAAAAALIPYVRRLQEAEEFQVKFALAVRGSDFSGLRSQLDRQIEAMQLWRERSAAVHQEFTGLSSEVDRLRAILQNAFGPSVDLTTQRILKLKDELAALAPGLTAASLAGLEAATARARAGAPGASVEEQIARTQQAFRLERVRLQQEAANQLQGLQPELRAVLAPGIAQEVGARIQLSVEQERQAIQRLRLQRPFAPLGGIPTPEEEAAVLMPPRLSPAQLEELTRAGQLPGFIRTRPPVAITSEAEEALLPQRLSPSEIQRLLTSELPQRQLEAQRELLAVQRSRIGLSSQEADALQAQEIRIEKLLTIEQARGTTAESLVTTTAEQVEQQQLLNLELERLAREDPLEGLRLGLQEVGEEWTRVGELMQTGVRRTGQDMARGLSDTFFNVVTGEFKKLSDLPRQFGAALLRTMTDTAAQLVTGAAFQQLRMGLGLRSFAPLGLLGFGGGGGGGGIVTAQQAQALQAAGIPVGLSSTGQFVVTGAGAGGGGFQFPGIPLGGLQGFLPGGIQNFLATPLLGGPLAGAFAAPAGSALATEAAALGIGAGGLGPAGLTFGQALGAAGGALGLAFTIFSALQGPPTAMNIVTSGASGALSGALLGSAIFPGVGTAVGAIAGGLLGAGAAAFGKGGGQQKKRDIRGISRAEGLSAAGAFQSALRGTTTLEGLIDVLNASYAPHPPRQWTIAATRSDGSLIRTGLHVIGFDRGINQGRSWGFEPDDLFDPSVIDTLEVIAGEHGAEEQQPGIVDEIRAKIEELAQERAQIQVTAAERLPGGLLRETTVPGTLAKRLAGKQLVVEAGSLVGLEEDRRVAELRALAKLDYDQSLGILWREPDTGEAVSLTAFGG